MTDAEIRKLREMSEAKKVQDLQLRPNTFWRRAPIVPRSATAEALSVLVQADSPFKPVMHKRPCQRFAAAPESFFDHGLNLVERCARRTPSTRKSHCVDRPDA